MAGETDLDSMLATLSVSRRPGTYAFVSVEDAQVPTGPELEIEAIVREAEGLTLVASTAVARAHGWAYDFEAAWLTLDVHSALEAVGLTAVISRALAEHGIACNVLAGFHHDHLLVPATRAEEAITVLEGLRDADPVG